MDRATAHERWAELVGLLADADSILDWDGLELDDLDRAEGLRYLARLIQVAVDARLSPGSPRHPAFLLLSNGFGMDNPDNHYLGASVDPNLDYRISGRYESLSYLSFAAQNQNYARTDGITGGAGHLHGRELTLDGNGGFEIIASRVEQPGNWLRFAEDTTLLLARQTRADAATESWIDLEIECLDVDGPPPPLDPTWLATELSMVGLYTLGASQWFVEWVTPWLERPNEFALADPAEQQRVGGDPNILAQSGYWRLEPGERLEIEFIPPACAYWNIQLANVWAESLDTRRQVWRNHVTSSLDDDGVARFVIAEDDPGGANWLDPAGHRHGLMHIRFVDSDAHPLAATRLVR